MQLQTVVMLFSIVTAIALVVQVGILTALFLQLKRTTESINKTVNDLNTRVSPILTRTQLMLDDTQPKLPALSRMPLKLSTLRAARRKRWIAS
jgi:uncharacterized protein YoxC